MKYITTLRLLYKRNILATLRNPVWLVIGLFQPVLYLLLFAPLLGNLSGVPGFPQGGAFTVFTPGLLVMVALFNTAYVGFGLVGQIREGVVERLLVTPTPRSAILLGYILRDITALLVQSAIVVLISLPLGLHANFLGLVVTFGMMVLSGILMSSCSYALALRLKSEDSMASVLNTMSAPLLLLSGITLPLTLAPQIIRSIASVNPFAYEVTAARSLFLGNFSDSAILVGLLFLGGLAALAFIWAARSFRRGAM
jgi:ABC-2 type transport system permease protein